jgi:hypothetical protein
MFGFSFFLLVADLGSGVQNSILVERASNHRAEPWSAKIEF